MVSTVSQGSSRAIEADLVPIREALEVAFAVARRDRGDRSAPEPPRVLAPILGFSNLPERALGTVRDALEGDVGFRSRVVEHVDTEALDEGSRLFLTRPEGWAAALGVLVEEAARRAESYDLAQRLGEANEARLALSELRDQLCAERDELAASVAEMTGTGAAQAERIETLQAQLAEAADAISELKEGRREAVRQLKVQEDLAQRRLQRQRELEEDLEQHRQAVGDAAHREADVQGTDDMDRAELERMAVSVAEVMAKAGELVEALGGVAGYLERFTGEPHTSAADDRGAVKPGPGADRKRPLRRRRPVRLGRGLDSDSIEGFDVLLGTAGTVVMVDGYNVSMKGWPNLQLPQQRESLLDAVGVLQARGGATWHLVFDGSDDGARPAVSAPLAVRVHFTPSGIEADDRLLEFVEQVPDDVAVVVVSSDHRVRDGARDRGANVVSSETLLSLARRS